MKNLNTNEALVLQAVINSADDHAGGDFTYIEYVLKEITTLKINQVKGYLSILQTKNYINCCEGGQITAGDKFDYNSFYEPNYIGA